MNASHIAKYKKYHKQKIRLKSTVRSTYEPVSGSFAIRAVESTRLSENHYGSLQRVFKRHSKKVGAVWFTGNPDRPISAKPVNIRMGKGKGATAFWAHMVPTGSIIAEMGGLHNDTMARISKLLQKKSPSKVRCCWVRTKFHK